MDFEGNLHSRDRPTILQPASNSSFKKNRENFLEKYLDFQKKVSLPKHTFGARWELDPWLSIFGMSLKVTENNISTPWSQFWKLAFWSNFFITPGILTPVHKLTRVSSDRKGCVWLKSDKFWFALACGWAEWPGPLRSLLLLIKRPHGKKKGRGGKNPGDLWEFGRTSKTVFSGVNFRCTKFLSFGVSRLHKNPMIDLGRPKKWGSLQVS